MYLRIGTLVAGFLFAIGCFSIAGGEWKGHEMERVKSGDGRSEVVAVQGSAGATTSVTTLVFVVAPGTAYEQNSPMFDKDRAVFRADKVKDLSLGWTRPGFLEIRFQKARVFDFTNFTEIADTGGNRYRVEIGLVPLDPDSSLIPDDTGNQSR
jgi:hypothetical protein